MSNGVMSTWKNNNINFLTDNNVKFNIYYDIIDLYF